MFMVYFIIIIGVSLLTLHAVVTVGVAMLVKVLMYENIL